VARRRRLPRPLPRALGAVLAGPLHAAAEVVLLGPHGGGLNGFILVRDSKDQMAAVRDREEFARINTRAAMVVDDLGVIDAALGDGVEEQLSVYREAIDNVVPA